MADQDQSLSSLSGEEAHSEEPHPFCGFHGDLQPLSVPCPFGGPGPPHQMVQTLNQYTPSLSHT